MEEFNEEEEEEEMGSERIGQSFCRRGFRDLRVVCKGESEGFGKRFRRQNLEESAIHREGYGDGEW